MPARVAAQRAAETYGGAAARKAAFGEAEAEEQRLREHPASAGSIAPPRREPQGGSVGDPVRRLRALEALSRDRDPRQAGQTIGQRRFLELDLRKAARQEGVVGLHVEVPVSAEVERNPDFYQLSRFAG